MIKYMHTIDGQPALFWLGEQICFANSRTIVPLVPDLKTIKREQRASRAWRRKQGWTPSDYGWVRVEV